MIRRGLRIDDENDSITPAKEERVSLDANRNKDAFQRDMDSLLFGGGPIRKREPKKQQPALKKEIQPTKLVLTTQTPIKPKTSITKKQDSLTEYKSLELQQKVTEKYVEKSTQLMQSKTKITPKKKQQNQPLKTSRASRLQPSVVLPKQDTKEKFLKDRQKSTLFKEIENSRPNYIRKSIKVCEEFDFAEENRIKHKNIDVVRSIMCNKSYITKLKANGDKDKQFPPVKTSLGIELQNNYIKWQKYESFVNSVSLGKYVDPNDIKKGQFSSFKFLSTLSVLAENQENIKRLIEDQHFDPQNSIYFVRLFINSVWRFYAVDSYVPFLQGQPSGAINYNDAQSDMWVMLIQKAYAKAFQGYDVFQKPQPRQYYLRDLTGAPTQNYKSEIPQIIEIVKSAIEKKKIIMAVPKPNASLLGINTNGNLTVLNLNSKNGLTLRYSWPLVQEKRQIPISKEGIIELSELQVKQQISHFAIAHINRQYFTTTIQTRHEKGFYVAYKIIVKQKTHGYFTLTQFDERQFPKDSYQYESARLFIHKKTQNNTYEYVKGGFSYKERNLDVQIQLTPGEYQVFAFVNWTQQVYDFNLTFYGTKLLDLVKIPTIKDHNIISLGLQSYNLQNGKRSALGHVYQFVNYHQETNLVLITILNTSAKDYQYINDLQKINFQSLNLLNLTNNQHNCLENLSTKELQAYKLFAQQNRKWQILLEPQQSFTWVISTSESYNLNNFKNWGFR